MNHATHALKQFKHQAFLARKRHRQAQERRALRQQDHAGRSLEKAGHGPIYTPGRYSRTFVERPEPPHQLGTPIPRVIHTVWFGDHMPQRRRHSLEALRALNPGIPVTLIGENNINDYILPEHPLHPAFWNLTSVHQSDYLRIYMMHFHGGGYSDLKNPYHPWGPMFDALQSAPQCDVLGYREITSNYTSENPRTLGEDLKKFYRFLIAPSAFIMRPYSLFTACTYRELLRRMDYCAPALTDSPVQDTYHLPHSYPVWWGELMGDIIHCLSLRYPERVLFDDRIKPQLKDYR